MAGISVADEEAGHHEPAVPTAEPRSRSLRQTWHRLLRNRGAVIGLVIVGAYIAVALFASVLAPYDPLEGNLIQRLEGPSAAHWLGIDELGRDVLSRLIYGAWVSLQIQVAGVVVATTVGVLWGLLAGYFGSWVDDLSMRLVDVLMAFPSILLAIAIVAILGGGFLNVIIAIGIGSAPQFARLVRGVVLGLREMEYVQAAEAIGEPHMSIMWRYIRPGTNAAVIVQSTLRMATLLLTAAGLSFLGLGVSPPTPEWGAMLSNARDYMFLAPHVTIAPGLAITIVVIGFNLLGDGLRDVLDPRMRQ